MSRKPPPKPDQVQTLASAWAVVTWHLGQMFLSTVTRALLCLLLTGAVALLVGSLAYTWGTAAGALRCLP